MRCRYAFRMFCVPTDEGEVNGFLNEKGQEGYHVNSMTACPKGDIMGGWISIVMEQAYDDPDPVDLCQVGETPAEAVQRIIFEIRKAGGDVLFLDNRMCFRGLGKASDEQMAYLGLHRDQVREFLASESAE